MVLDHLIEVNTMGLDGVDVGESRTRNAHGPGFDSPQIHWCWNLMSLGVATVCKTVSMGFDSPQYLLWKLAREDDRARLLSEWV